MATCVEMAIELQLSEITAQMFSKTLSEVDKVMIILASSMTEAISIYNGERKLVFASKALTAMLQYDEISEAANLIASPSIQNDQSPDDRSLSKLSVGPYSVDVRRTGTDHTIFSWTAGS